MYEGLDGTLEEGHVLLTDHPLLLDLACSLGHGYLEVYCLGEVRNHMSSES